MKRDRAAAERMILDLAYFNEVKPDTDPKVNEFWAKIRNNHDMDCLTYGKCEVCGEEGVMGEYVFTLVCKENKDCHKKIAAMYEKAESGRRRS